MASIVLDHVEKIYPNGVKAVQDLSLEIAEGELIVLLGPSGCGKTTTLRLIAGLETPTAGTIRLNERVVNSLPAHRREVAMVFQSYGLYPHLRVRDNLKFALRMRGGESRLKRFFAWLMPAKRRAPSGSSATVHDRVLEVAQLLDLESLLDRYPGQLSGGQQQRAALGKAIARQPQATLLDEPLSNLDLQLRNHLRRQLHLLHRRLRVTMVYVTHDQTEALGLADRIAVMNEGKIHQVGRPESLYNEPATRWVAGFIGWPPINFVEGGMVSLDGQVCFQTGNWLWPLGSSERQLGQAYLGKAITLGIRPEHLDLGKEPAFAMQVVQVETLGSDRLVSLTDGTRQLVGRWARANGIEAGQVVKIGFDMSQVKWFDGVNGLALSFSGNSSG
jgi:multiple sugar transport system ATP-binding protein